MSTTKLFVLLFVKQPSTYQIIASRSIQATFVSALLNTFIDFCQKGVKRNMQFQEQEQFKQNKK